MLLPKQSGVNGHASAVPLKLPQMKNRPGPFSEYRLGRLIVIRIGYIRFLRNLIVFFTKKVYTVLLLCDLMKLEYLFRKGFIGDQGVDIAAEDGAECGFGFNLAGTDPDRPADTAHGI